MGVGWGSEERGSRRVANRLVEASRRAMGSDDHNVVAQLVNLVTVQQPLGGAR